MTRDTDSLHEASAEIETEFHRQRMHKVARNKFLTTATTPPAEAGTNSRHNALTSRAELLFGSVRTTADDAARRDTAVARAVKEYGADVFTIQQVVALDAGASARPQFKTPSDTSAQVNSEQVEKVFSLQLGRRPQPDETLPAALEDDDPEERCIISFSWSAQRTLVEMGLTRCALACTVALPLSALARGLSFVDAILRHPEVSRAAVPGEDPLAWQRPSAKDGPWARLLVAIARGSIPQAPQWGDLASDIREALASGHPDSVPAWSPAGGPGSIARWLDEDQAPRMPSDRWVTVGLVSARAESERQVDPAATVEQHLAARALHALIVVDALQREQRGDAQSPLAALTWPEFTWWLSFYSAHPSIWAFDKIHIELGADVIET